MITKKLLFPAWHHEAILKAKKKSCFFFLFFFTWNQLFFIDHLVKADKELKSVRQPFYCSFQIHNGADWQSFLTSLPVRVPSRAQQDAEALPSSPPEHTENRNRYSSASLNGYPMVFNKHGNEMQTKAGREKKSLRGNIPVRGTLCCSNLLIFLYFSAPLGNLRDK